MRIFSIPSAFLLAFCLYPLLPAAAGWLDQLLIRLYDAVGARFTSRRGRRDEALALLVCVLLAGGCAALLGAVHPVAAAIVMTPLFSGLSVLPGCARTKDVLDSGAYARDIPAYEALVRESCASLAPAFSCGAVAPLLLVFAGSPFHLSCALGWMYAVLRAANPGEKHAKAVLSFLQRLSDRLFCALLILCSGVVGRNPLRTTGSGSQSRLMHILGIAGDKTDTHAPMAGDITQGIFLCCFCVSILCFLLTVLFFALCA